MKVCCLTAIYVSITQFIERKWQLAPIFPAHLSSLWRLGTRSSLNPHQSLGTSSAIWTVRRYRSIAVHQRLLSPPLMRPAPRVFRCRAPRVFQRVHQSEYSAEERLFLFRPVFLFDVSFHLASLLGGSEKYICLISHFCRNACLSILYFVDRIIEIWKTAKGKSLDKVSNKII